MLDNRITDAATYGCTCRTRTCVNVILAVLAIVLALVVGAILGAVFAAAITAAIVPLAIFAVGVLLAIILIYFFVRCKCRAND